MLGKVVEVSRQSRPNPAPGSEESQSDPFQNGFEGLGRISCSQSRPNEDEKRTIRASAYSLSLKIITACSTGESSKMSI